MRSDWLLTTPVEDLGAIAARRVTRVMLEFDGPQMTVLVDAHGTYVALAVDEDHSGVRWLQVPISPVDLSVLERGALPVRDIFEQEGVAVVDYAHGADRPGAAWLLAGWVIPDAVLPRRGVRLARNPDD